MRRKIPSSIQKAVRQRASFLCEYCHVSEIWQYVAFTMEHVIPISLDIFKRNPSPAKDAIWELEVWRKLKSNYPSVVLKDPPDVLIEYDSVKIGIACKKLYSEKHVQNVLSQAVHQLERSITWGIAAINLDDLLPTTQVIEVDDFDALKSRLINFNQRFLKKHERHFKKYLSKERLVSAIVSTSLIVDVKRADPRIHICSQWNVWAMPGLSKQQEKILKFLYRLLGMN